MAALNTIKHRWERANSRERVTYVVGVAAALLAVVVVSVRTYGGRSTLDPKAKTEANAIVEDLRNAEADRKPAPKEPVVEIEPGGGRKPQGPS